MLLAGVQVEGMDYQICPRIDGRDCSLFWSEAIGDGMHIDRIRHDKTIEAEFSTQ